MPRTPCIAQVGDFIVVRDLTENPDWLGRVFCVERTCANPFDPFGGCCPPNNAQMFYHYVALRHVGRISVQRAECIEDKCDLLVLEKRSREWWGRWRAPDGRSDLISASEEWRAWSQAGCLNDFRPPGFEGISGGLLGGCGGDPRCCPPC